MTDLKNSKGSISSPLPPPPPPPPPSLPEVVQDNSSKFSSSPITNGTCHNGGISAKPRPPAKPSKLTRAFSTGSMTLGRLGKKSAKKNSLQENNFITIGEVAHDVYKEEGENDVNTPWKLPGIGSKPVLRKIGSFKKSRPQSISESPTAERELPPLPDLSEDTKPPQRKLPPIPDTNGCVSSVDPNTRDLPSVPEASDSSPLTDSTRRELPPVPTEESEGSSSHNISNLISSAADAEVPTAEVPGNKVSKKNSFSKAKSDTSNGLSTNSSQEESFKPLQSEHKSSSPKKEENPTSGEIVSKLTPPQYNGNNLTKEEPNKEVVEDEGHENTHTANTQDLNKCDMNDDDDMISECSLSSMENSPDAMHRSTASLTKHNSSISSAEPVVANDDTAPKDETEVEFKDSYTIGEIVNSYSYAVPVSMRILQGYFSDTSDVNISTDDVYFLHSIHHSSMVTIRDDDSMTHKIPVDSPVKIGLIYNPKGDYEESLNGYEFKMVSDILAMPTPPKLIYAKQAIITGEEKSSVSEGEIFRVGHTNKSVFKSKRGLKVFSLLTRSKKLILDSSLGCFSTKPSLVRVELASFMELFTDIFPAQVVVYPDTMDSTSSQEFPGPRSRVATILGRTTETALVVSDVSTLTEEEVREANLQPIPTESPISFDLLLDDDIAALEVIVQRWTYPEEEEEQEEEEVTEETVEGGEEHCYDDTVAVFGEEQSKDKEIKSSSVPTTPEKRTSVASMDDHFYVNVQKDLNSSTQSVADAAADTISEKEKQFFEEDEDAGYDIVGLHLIGKVSPVIPPRDSSLTASPLLPVNPGCSSVGVVPSAPLPRVNGYSKIGPKTIKTSKKPSKGYSLVLPHCMINGVVIENSDAVLEKKPPYKLKEKQVASDSEDGRKQGMETKASSEASEMSRMQMMLEMLTKKMDSVDSQLVKLASTPVAANTKEESPQPLRKEEDKAESKSEKVSSESENLEFLRSLEVEQVGDLISAMGLEQYVNKFLTEQISGEILMECDDDVLKDEIGITSKIHRIRLLKVISGQHSAKGILEKKKRSA